MSVPQYTIRNMPVSVDRYLRKKAKLSGQSLNKVIIEELSEKVGIGSDSPLNSLDWFIGGQTIDKNSLDALKEEDVIQKQLATRELGNGDRY